MYMINRCTKLLKLMTKGRVSPANLNRNREVIFQFETIRKNNSSSATKNQQNPPFKLGNSSRRSRKNAVLHLPKFFVNASADIFAVGKKVNATLFCSASSRRKCRSMAKCFVFLRFIECLLRAY